MAPPLYSPISFYINWYKETNPSTWTPAVGGMHLDCASVCHNSYGLGYIEIVLQPRFAEAIDVLDTAYHISEQFAGAAQTDQRHRDPAFNVCRWLYYTAGGVSIQDECHRPGRPNEWNPNPQGIRDPIHFLYSLGWWRKPEGYKPIGVDPDPWKQPVTFDTGSQYYKYIAVDQNNLPTVYSEQTGAPITPSWLSQYMAGETRNVCGISMTLADLASRLQHAGGFGGPWTWDAMIAAYQRANPSQCGTSGGGGGGGGGTGGSGGNQGGSFDPDSILDWIKRNQTAVLLGIGTFAAIKVLMK